MSNRNKGLLKALDVAAVNFKFDEMKKITVYFSEEDYKILEDKSKKTGLTINDLIVQAIKKVYLRKSRDRSKCKSSSKNSSSV